MATAPGGDPKRGERLNGLVADVLAAEDSGARLSLQLSVIDLSDDLQLGDAGQCDLFEALRGFGATAIISAI